jgi:ankyrin repeat protein
MTFFKEYLINYGTKWQTVPCPLCKKKVSYHIMLEQFIKVAEFEDVVIVINAFNINIKCHMDRSLLMVAAAAGKMDIVKYLINQGLPVNKPNNFGLNVFYYAAINGQLDIVKYLVENFKIDINCESFFGETPLDMALKKKHYNVVEYLQTINAKNGTSKNQDFFSNKNIVKRIIDSIK